MGAVTPDEHRTKHGWASAGSGMFYFFKKKKLKQKRAKCQHLLNLYEKYRTFCVLYFCVFEILHKFKKKQACCCNFKPTAGRGPGKHCRTAVTRAGIGQGAGQGYGPQAPPPPLGPRTVGFN